MDIAELEDIRHVTDFDTPGYAMGISQRDNYLYVADGTEGLQVYVINVPKSIEYTSFNNYDSDSYSSSRDIIVSFGSLVDLDPLRDPPGKSLWFSVPHLLSKKG